MSNCLIRFKYHQKDVLIQCQKNEMMRDIISHFGTKINIPVDELFFFTMVITY